ncbi:MAG TPA: DEAD/DEAH box helicase [Candidatus Aminicenantes bacterium]|nr:DEAD/DEAH box helicase [Candidatus Aminicenantes bacterium]
MLFTELPLDPRLQQSIADRGYVELTHVQELTLGKSLEGRDVAVQSQTGTGKTAAFLITLYSHMLKHPKSARRKALIIVPTRELAVQIEGEALLLNRSIGLTIGCFYGGVGYTVQLAQIKAGPDIIIGTPGRLLDLAEKKRLNFKECGFLVIDEADRLFDMGFLPDLRDIVVQMPDRTRRQTMLFSATLNKLARRVAEAYLNAPVFIEATPGEMTVETISQEIYRVGSHIKLNLLLGLLLRREPRNALIFTNMKHTAFLLAKQLQANGRQAKFLSGDLPQSERLRIIEDFMAGRFPILVATDVASRGLHIEDLEMVVNYDVPQDAENYVHRIGRTARAGAKGLAVTLASEKTADHIEAIEKFIGQKIPVLPVTADMFARDMSLERLAGQDLARRPSRRRGGGGRGGGRDGRRRPR